MMCAVTLAERTTTDLLSRSALELAAAIRSGEVTSREVVEAHIARLEAFQPRTGAIAVPCFESARAAADEADRFAGERPPLHGVPCTIKESFACAGLPHTAGLVARREFLAEADAPTVALLREAGAIPLATTNTSELCMWIESENRVYGRTSSAYDPRRVAGGSSGGEGAAVGSGGSPFGLAADIGGSVRVPAFFNGVFGHKPSPGLISNEGQFPIAEGEALRLLSPGPICRRAEDLMPVVRILADEEAARLGDPADVSVQGLDVVVVEGDGVLPVSRRMAGALQRAAGALQAMGARVRTERVRRLRTAFNSFLAELAAANATSFATMLGGDAGPVRLRDALRRSAPHTRASKMILLAEHAQHLLPDVGNERLRAGGRKLTRRLHDLVGDGVLLYPTHPWVVPRHGWTLPLPMAVAYTAVFNLAGTPATQVPVGLEDRRLPLGVQVVGAEGNDHVTIAVACALERALGGWVDPAAQ
jgi:fatty acid amide hydrolase 2